MSEKIDSGNKRVKNDGRVGKAVGARVSGLVMVIMRLASIAIAVVYFAGAGQVQSESSQGYGEGFNANVPPVSGILFLGASAS